MVKTPEGLVCMVYYQPIPKLIKIEDRAYVFNCQYGIAMIFVPEEEVPPLLAFRGGCCGGQRQVIFLANEVQYSHWQNGKGGR